MDRQTKIFIAVVALVGAITLTIYHFISGNPIGDYWLAGVLFVIAIVVWLWSNSENTPSLFDIDPALRGGDPTHAQEAYPLNLLEDAPQVLGDVPDVAPPEFDKTAVKVVQDSHPDDRLTEIVPSADVIEPITVEEAHTEETVTEVVADVVETAEAEEAEESAETVADEPAETVSEVVEVVTEAEPEPEAIVAEADVIETDAQAPDAEPLPDYAEAQITPNDESDAEANNDAIEENNATDAPEPYSVSSDVENGEEEAVVTEEAEVTASADAETASETVTTEETATSAPANDDSPESFDLTKIEGIGVKYQEALHGAGITTFEQLAGLSVDQLVEIAQSAGMRRAGSMETWAEQAKLAADGKWDELQKLQDELTGGRRES